MAHGVFVDGVWHSEWYDSSTNGGRFIPADPVFRNWIQVCRINIIKSIWRGTRGVMHEVRMSRLVLRIATWVSSVVIELWVHYD